jgi:hypothetical protein
MSDLAEKICGGSITTKSFYKIDLRREFVCPDLKPLPDVLPKQI